MTNYYLRDDLSFCLVDDRPIFLDIESDRYFRLSDRMQGVFMNWLGHKCTKSDLALLVERKILTSQLTRSGNPRVSVKKAQLSALELPLSRIPCSAKILMEVITTVYWTQVLLKAIGIKGTAERGLGPHSRLERNAAGSDQTELFGATQIFLTARKLVPIGMRCLLDSLAMAKFLKRRGMRVEVVVGVTSNPFSAHCWVQAGDMVLNDALGNVGIYSPIRTL